jgi:hypothetical protein
VAHNISDLPIKLEGELIMVTEEKEDTLTYKVVVNHEEQYSIWFADREPPLGWKEAARTGPSPNASPISRKSRQI